MRSKRIERFVNGALALAFMFVLGVSLAVLTLAFLRPDFSQPFFEHAGPEPSSVVVVEPGDTIWALALEHFPGIDPRITTQAILSINNLSSALIYPGQVIVLPYLDGQPTLKLAVNQGAY